ncbi:MAG: carboxypeptidase-like regulatory domain-containing protein [Candidatus Korobacteraceae bacterium]
MFGLLALLAIATIAGAQEQKLRPAKAGVVSGSVFAITKGGDLKPARMADVYLLYKYRSVKWANSHPEDYEGSTDHAWADNYIKTLHEHTKELAAEGMAWSDKLACLKSLQVYHDALSQTRDWASANHKGWQILTTQADENGVFKIAVPHPGTYTILASGHAGFNDAFWYDMMELGVVVNPGATTTVKLSSPAAACVTE